MPNDFAYVPDGVQLENRHVNQILLNLTGKLQQGIPITLRGSANQPLLIVDDSGVKLSRDGVEAPTSPFVPIGGVIMWSRPVAEIPAGWAVCDGSNGTPDLRDRFILGAGAISAAGLTGGAPTINLSHSHTGGLHDHGATSSDGTGVTSFDGTGSTSSDGGGNTGTPSTTTTFDEGADASFTVASATHRHSGTVHSHSGPSHRHNGPSHSHTTSGSGGTATSSDGAVAQSILPPFYAAVWIRRQV